MSITREQTASDLDRATDGRGPRGMWWVAWRLHRTLLIGIGAAAVGMVVALICFRWGLAHDLRVAAGVDADACRRTWDAYDPGPSCPRPADEVLRSYRRWWIPLNGVLTFGPTGLGLVAGIALLANEFDRRTALFALTQSAGRLRWWGVTLLGAGIPLLTGALVVGLVRQWAAGEVAYFRADPFDVIDFATASVAPPALALVGLALGSTVAVVLRSALPALVAATVLGSGVLVGLSYIGPFLLPADRSITTSITASGWVGVIPIPDDSRYITSGFLAADGTTTSFTECETWGNPEAMMLDPRAQDDIRIACLTSRGFTRSFIDYLGPDRLGELRAVFSTLCALIAAGFFATGASVLRRRAVR